MRVRELPGWPPSCASAYSGLDKFATGEDGTLKNLRWSDQTGLLAFIIEYEGGSIREILNWTLTLRKKSASLLHLIWESP